MKGKRSAVAPTFPGQRKKTGTKPAFFVGGDKRDRTADLSGGKRRKARRRRVLIEMQEVSGVQTCRFHQMKKAAFRLPHSFGGDKRDRTADLLNAIQALSQAIISMPPFMSNGNDKDRNSHATISMVFKNCSMLIFSVILIS